jgi:glycosyltransferase involved in cell wall biosynthesis
MVASAENTPPKLSAILIVKNEAHCLGKCLRSIAPVADEIIVLDSGSTDDTVAIARAAGARVEVTDWPGFGPQKNRALDRASGTWVLSIDADEHLTAQLATAIRAVVDAPEAANGYFIRRIATWCGKPVRFGDWADKPTLRLFRRDRARFTDDLIHERVVCDPPHAILDGIMMHDTVAADSEADEKCRRYAELSAGSLAARNRGGLAPALLHGAWTFLRGYVFKGGFLDGTTGWKVASATTRGTWLRYRLAGRMPSAESDRGAASGNKA